MQEKLKEFLDNVQKLYYSKFDDNTFANAAFDTKPSAGICIVKLN